MAISGGRFIALPLATFTIYRISSLQGSCEYQMTNQFFSKMPVNGQKLCFRGFRVIEFVMIATIADFLILT